MAVWLVLWLMFWIMSTREYPPLSPSSEQARLRVGQHHSRRRSTSSENDERLRRHRAERSSSRRKSSQRSTRYHHSQIKSSKIKKSSKNKRSNGNESAISSLSDALVESLSKVAQQYGNTRAHNQVGIGMSLSNNIVPEFDPRKHNLDEWLHAVYEYALLYD